MALHYDNLKSFAEELEKRPTSFSLKVMGIKRTKAPVTGAMLSEVYRDTGDPDATVPPLTTCFGFIQRRGASLAGGEQTYSNGIVPAKDGTNTFQGDIIDCEVDFKPMGFNKVASRAIVISHSNEIKRPAVTVCPVFFESEIDQALLDFLNGSPIKDFKAGLQKVFRNENPFFIGLPAHGTGGFFLPDEQMLVPLMFFAVPSATLATSPTVLRLTYRANSYLQCRLAVALLRDFDPAHETREF